MPEGRMLKKAISESKTLGILKSDSARLIYTWLIPFLDVEGRHSADPEIIKGHIFPKVKSMTIPKIQALLLELAEGGLIILYMDRVKDEPCLQLTKFHDHQKLDPGKEGKSKFPEPTSEDIENKTAPEFSGPTLEKSSLSKVKVKVKLKGSSREGRAEPGALLETESPSPIEKEFDKFWEAYDYKIKRTDALKAYKAIRAMGVPLGDLAQAVNGYHSFLKNQETRRNFQQAKMYPSTFLREDRWKDYIGVKYAPPL
jgi:hypothetical protein